MSRNSGKQLRGWYAYSDSKTWEANVSATRQTLRKRSERVVLDLLKHADVSDDCGFSSHFNVFAGEECGQHIWIRYTSCSKTLSSPSLGGKRIGRWEQRGQHWYAG
ncbi:hypothetical protein NXS19_014370 [Fusarium pseudograminearum]|nr:hypothetical protein NXS19_014370 [Fusarium pseudograminearum]